MSSRRALALRHTDCTDLGSFESLLHNADFAISYADASTAELAEIDPNEPDLLVILDDDQRSAPGGHDVPGCAARLLIERRLRDQRATLGLGLGGALVAQALGARIHSESATEIGWCHLTLTGEGQRSALRHLDGAHTPVFQWHRRILDLPLGARLLASTPLCRNQAFSWGETALGLQFHPEVTARQLEAWYARGAEELVAEGISLENLRLESAQYAPLLQAYAEPFLHAWLASAGL
jgi:GMP synthase (glutamine-hydrolysing)